ncbi:MAG: hypothetical protein HOW73_23445 [Polyangiaceae bacterium]|nr:hypothetical protein [Polyangiaceae bacterium]
MTSHNLIVLSDIHLGSDLIQHARPDAPPRGRAASRRDRELVALLDWYRCRREGRRPWRIVFAGDLVDFVGMAVTPITCELQTEPTEEEREYGLGSATDHTIAKLRCVAEHHRDVFLAMARFVAAGNTMVIVRGNHDVEFHWEAVQATFREILLEFGAQAPERIEFSDWFYYEEGVVYIEHGHQYDDYCAYEHVLFPVLPSDPRRTDRSIADVLLRRVVRPTRGMKESGHEHASALDYVRFAMKLGLGGLVGLGRRFVVAIGALLVLWRHGMKSTSAWVKKEHERKMSLLAEARNISVLKLRALASLHKPPVTRSLIRVLAGVMLDRVVFSLLMLAGLVWLLVARWTPLLGVAVGACVLSAATGAWLFYRARGSIDPSEALRERAARVCTLLPTAFVVMGHTHSPEIRKTSSGTEYVNVGAWAEEDDEDNPSAKPSTRTHLVLTEVDGRTVASLLAWDSESGPRRFTPSSETDAA